MIEVHRILDSEQVEVVDLLDDNPQPRLIVDRSCASHAVRFLCLLIWYYEMPHYYRFNGNALAIPTMPPTPGQPVWGRVLAALDRVRIEAGSFARYQALRAQFEKFVGRIVEFTEERITDLASQLRDKDRTSFDTALVPPRLLEHAPRLRVMTSRIDPPPLPQRTHAEKEVLDRLGVVGTVFPTPESMLDAFERGAPELFGLMDVVMKEHNDFMFAMLIMSAGQLWCVFLPPDARPISINIDRAG